VLAVGWCAEADTDAFLMQLYGTALCQPASCPFLVCSGLIRRLLDCWTVGLFGGHGDVVTMSW
jgi:hypothetical protein